MNRRQQITVTCAAVALLAGLLVWATRPREPVYQGKRISEWIGELRNAQPCDGHPAWNAIQAMGPKAVPHLLSAIEVSLNESKPYLWFRSILPGSASRQVLLSTVPVQMQNLRGNAFYGLQVLGPDAQEAVPKLVPWLRHRDLRSQATETIRTIGPGAIAALPSLILALKDTDVHMRVQAAQAIGALGPGAVEANNALIATLNDPNERVRVAAARSLAMIGHIGSQAQPALLNLLAQTNRFAHSAAAVALWRMEPTNAEASARVAGCLQDEAHQIPAMYLLGKAGPVALEFLPLVNNFLTNEDWKVRHFATNAVKSIDPDAAVKAGIKQ